MDAAARPPTNSETQRSEFRKTMDESVEKGRSQRNAITADPPFAGPKIIISKWISAIKIEITARALKKRLAFFLCRATTIDSQAIRHAKRQALLLSTETAAVSSKLDTAKQSAHETNPEITKAIANTFVKDGSLLKLSGI